MYELAVERFIAVPPQAVYRTWIERLPDWWAPRPWTTELTAFDPRPGGAFAMTMSGPDGARSPFAGVLLEIVPNERLVFTNAFTVGWVPQAPFMVGLFTFDPEGAGTRYRAAARHWDEATLEQHKAMGFEAGWTAVAQQLADLVEAT